MRESSHHLAGLRQRIARLAQTGGPEESGWLASGHGALDAALGGGLARGRVHEIFSSGALDAASAAGFAALLALRSGGTAPILWLRPADAGRRTGHIHAPGFAELGGNPDRLLLVEAGDARTLLGCANDAARTPGSAAVIVESWGHMPALDLTAGRRLALAARTAGVTLLLLRLDAEPTASVAETRWRVAAATSQALAANAPGPPVIDVELLRWRAGPAGMRWRLEWNRDDRSFREPALSGAVLPLSGGRAAVPHTAAAA